MTTITTVVGLIPLVLFPGAGSELYRGLGAVVLGGLLVSTIFTLFLTPALFSLFMDAVDLAARLLRRSPAAEMAELAGEETEREEEAAVEAEDASEQPAMSRRSGDGEFSEYPQRRRSRGPEPK
jgi:HAE1 family hydrophobic/amphiphilic exporter-1